MITEKAITDNIERMRRSISYRDAERRLGYVAVVMVASATALPRYADEDGVGQFSHNDRGYHVAVSVVQDPDRHAAEISATQYQVPATVVAYVWVASKAHGDRIKSRIETALGGDRDENWVRNRWYWINGERNLRDAWDVLLASALQDIEMRGEYVETWDDRQKFDRVFQESRRRAR